MSEIKAAKHSLNNTGNTYFQVNTDDSVNVVVKNEYLYSFGVGYTFTDKPAYFRAGSVGATVGSMLLIDTAAGNWGPITWRNWDGSTYPRRWELGKEATAEGGANTGSHFYFSRFSDAGDWISSPIILHRTSGNVGINNIWTPTATLEVGGNIKDNKGPIRDIPFNTQGGSSYVLVAGDVGKCVSTTANVTIPSSVFTQGEMITIYNSGTATRNINNASGVTMRLGGLSDSNTRNITSYGLATILCVDTNTFVVSGAGVS